jgi:hypothetical protein
VLWWWRNPLGFDLEEGKEEGKGEMERVGWLVCPEIKQGWGGPHARDEGEDHARPAEHSELVLPSLSWRVTRTWIFL